MTTDKDDSKGGKSGKKKITKKKTTTQRKEKQKLTLVSYELDQSVQNPRNTKICDQYTTFSSH